MMPWLKKSWKETEILELIRAGGTKKEQALSYLAKAHNGLISRGQKRFGLSKTDAQDAYYESLLGLSCSIEKNQFRAESTIATYLFRIHENQCKNKLRKKKREAAKGEWIYEVPHFPDMARNILQQMIQEEELEELGDLLDGLGGKCRQILILHEYSGYSLEEIADKLGFKTARAVSTSKYRCMQKLKQLLDSLGGKKNLNPNATGSKPQEKVIS